MTFERINLESFERDGPAEPQESADYKRGYEAAMSATEQSRAEATALALVELSSTLNDMAFGFEEARAHLSARLHGLLIQLGDVALPQILQDSFGAHLNEVVEQHFDTLAGAPIRIAVTPDVEAELNHADSSPHSQFHFVADPSLTTGQALIHDGDAHVMLDLPSLLETLQSTLSSFDSFERTEKHG